MKTIEVMKLLWICLLLTVLEGNAATYYSRTSGGNWTDNSTWSTVTYGSSTNTGTFPKSGDYAYIGDGYTILVNANCTTSFLIVGQGSSGVLEYSDAGSYNLVVINNVTINSGANLRYNGNNTRTHTLFIGNNFSNAGTVDLFSDANDVVNIQFYRAANSIVSGTGSFDLNTVTIQKLTSSTFSVEVQSTTFESGIRELILTYGTFFHNNSSSYLVNSSAVSGFTIPADGVVRVGAGILHLSPVQSDCFLNGTITLLDGTLRIGSSDGSGGLRYEKPGSFNPRIDIQGGAMEVYGSITHKTGASSSPLIFSMSGGNLLLNNGSSGASSSVFHVNDVSGSSFTMTDGSVILQNPNTSGSGTADVILCGSNGLVSISSGFLILGNEQTIPNSVFTFKPVTGMSWPNIDIAGPAGASVTLCPVSGNADDIDAISIHVEPDKIFDVRSADGVSGDSRSVKLTGNFDGVNSLLCDGTYIGRTAELILEGGEGQQVGGTGNLQLYDLSLNNGGGASLGMDITITGSLNLISGILSTFSSAILTLGGSASIAGADASKYVDGPLRIIKSSSGTGHLIFPIGKNGNYRPIELTVNHSSADVVYYQAEMQPSSPRELGYILPGSIDRISGVRYFTMERTGASNLISGNITMNYGADDGVDDPSNLRVVQYVSGTDWVNLGGTGSSSGSGQISSGSFTGTGTIFALGNANGGSNPLPVTWLNFEATLEAGLVVLDWATASEINTDYFDVEKGFNEHEFVRLARLNAAGDANDITRYRYIDKQLMGEESAVYYRLKQVDRDGKFTYSKICVIQPQRNQDVIVYPVPTGSAPLNVSIPESWVLPVTLVFRDFTGRICFEKLLRERQNSLHFEELQTNAIPALLMVTDKAGKIFSAKLID